MRRLLTAAATMLLVAGCDLPLGLGFATTRELEDAALGELASAKSFEVSGSYIELEDHWIIDVQVARPRSKHVTVERNGVRLEAILIGTARYFRSQKVLAQQLGTDHASRNLEQAAGNAWWTGLGAPGPDPFDFTDAATLKAALINSDLVTRRDRVTMNGVETAELSGARAEVYIEEAAPHRLIRLRTRAGAVVEGIRQADLDFGHYGADFKIAAPRDVINFADLTTLPPNYTVVSVDTSGCGSPCLVQATLKNLGGRNGAKAPSTVSFQMSDLVSGRAIGGCTGTVAPDVDYNATTTVSCTIAEAAGADFAGAKVTAIPNNPGHA